MKLKKIASGLLALTLAATLSACSGKTEATPETTTLSASAETTSAETTAQETGNTNETTATATSETPAKTTTEIQVETTEKATEITETFSDLAQEKIAEAATETTVLTATETAEPTTPAPQTTSTEAEETTVEPPLATMETTTETVSETTEKAAVTTATESITKGEIQEMTEKTYTAETKNVKLLGRTYYTNNMLWCAFSGTGCEFLFTGKECKITIVGDSAAAVSGNDKNYTRIGVFMNGERVCDEMIDEPEKIITAYSGEAVKNAVISVVKLSETAMSTAAIKEIQIDGLSIEPTAEKKPYIEFIGDSITCGYGVDAPNELTPFSTETEDVSKGYAYLTAKALGADYSMVSISGYGIISGYTGDGTKIPAQTLPQYYGKLGFSYGNLDGVTPSSIEWDFARQPDIVVLNLGTNDASYAGSDVERQDEYKAQYIEFLKTVREKNPNAKIAAAYGVMDNTLTRKIMEALTEYTEQTGDENVSLIRLPLQNGDKNGYGADWHPSPISQQLAADKLIEGLNKLIEG